MITHRGIWAIAHTSSCSVSKHSYIPGAYHCKHLLITRPTNARRVSEANRIFNRTNPLIVAKIKDYENCTHAKFAQFSNNWQRFFPTHVCDTSCQLLTHAHRKLIKVGHSSRCALTRSRSSKPPSRHGRASACLSRNIWTVTHMSSQQLATLNCFHCVNKVSYS